VLAAGPRPEYTYEVHQVQHPAKDSQEHKLLNVVQASEHPTSPPIQEDTVPASNVEKHAEEEVVEHRPLPQPAFMQDDRAAFHKPSAGDKGASMSDVYFLGETPHTHAPALSFSSRRCSHRGPLFYIRDVTLTQPFIVLCADDLKNIEKDVRDQLESTTEEPPPTQPTPAGISSENGGGGKPGGDIPDSMLTGPMFIGIYHARWRCNSMVVESTLSPLASANPCCT
jgi:hypothetical protein